MLPTEKLKAIKAHAIANVPWYAEHGCEGVISRNIVQANPELLHSKYVPAWQGKISKYRTSGSSGKPISGLTTEFALRCDAIASENLSKMHGRQLNKNFGFISISNPGYPLWLDCYSRNMPAWLESNNVSYLTSYPSLLADLAGKNAKPACLEQLCSFAELVTDEQRAVVLDNWGLPLLDTYSSKECGMIASQAPDGSYFMHNDCTLFEEHNGEVLITTLNNYAMPLIRYAIGDYCTVEGGRLLAIAGRQRNMLQLADGTALWPKFIVSDWCEHFKAVQVQFVQKGYELTANIAGAKSPHKPLPEKLASWAMGMPIKLNFVSSIERPAHGKYEDFRQE